LFGNHTRDVTAGDGRLESHSTTHISGIKDNNPILSSSDGPSSRQQQCGIDETESVLQLVETVPGTRDPSSGRQADGTGYPL
jgi:hypothetical protein